LVPALEARTIPLSLVCFKSTAARTAFRQNREYGTCPEWLQTASNVMISTGPGGGCCNSWVFGCKGFKGHVPELSLVCCAIQRDCRQLSWDLRPLWFQRLSQFRHWQTGWSPRVLKKVDIHSQELSRPTDRPL